MEATCILVSEKMPKLVLSIVEAVILNHGDEALLRLEGDGSDVMTGEGIGEDAILVGGTATGGAEATLDGGGTNEAVFVVFETGGGTEAACMFGDTDGSIVVVTGGPNVEYSVATGGGAVLLVSIEGAAFIPSFVLKVAATGGSARRKMTCNRRRTSSSIYSRT